MGLLHTIKKFLGDPKHVTTLDGLEPGEVVVDGAVRVGPDGALQSPVKGLPCVAFVYTAAHPVPGRSGQLTERPLRHVEVFTSFELELEGGRLAAVPRVPGSFTREAHQKLAASYPDLRAAEELVSTRARVRVRGVARRRGDDWVLTYRKLEVLKPEPAAKKPGKRRG